MDYACGAQGVCVSLLTAQCDSVTWPADHDVDKVVWLGSLMDTSPPFDELVQPLENSVQLAVGDFNGQVELQGSRKVGWIACDVTGGPDVAKLAATHLVDAVGVPAIVGPIFSESVIAVADDVSTPGGTLLMAPGATSKNITDLDDSDLVWRTIASDVYQANAVVDTVATDLVAVGQALPTNLVILYKADEYGTNLLQDTITGFNDAIGDANVSTVEYPDPATFTDPDELTAALSLAVGSAYAQGPDYVVIYGTSEAANMIQGYVGAYAQSLMLDPMNTLPLPRFLVTHGAVPSMEGLEPLMLDPFEALVNGLIEGTSPAIQDPVNFVDYNIRYGIAFNDEEALTASGLSYDGALAVLFAMSAVPDDEEVTGAAIAANMSLLVDKDVTATPFTGLDLDFIEAIRNELVTGGTVDLHGVSGQLDFDLATGDVRQDQVRWLLLDNDGDTMDTAATPVLAPYRYYALTPDEETGTWVPFPTP
jgi:branched-chain amino acid transport system substrate-binding protein